MITIITGTPGAGKTLYAIDKLLRSMVGTTIKRKVDGVEVEEPRVIYSNINGLLLDHELIDDSAEGGLRNWHQWAKPGALIVYDEFQKAWPPRPNGSKVPDDIQALDTHRHMGVDFILITQSVMNTDRHIHALCNRHLHVRRMGNLGLTIVYEWDHASRTLMYSKALAKAPYRYNKSVFELYKSADAHTKQPRRIPPLLFVILAAVGAAAYLGPSVAHRIGQRTGFVDKAEEAKVQQGKPGAPAAASGVGAVPGSGGTSSILVQGAYDQTAMIPRISNKPESAPAFDQLRQVVTMPVVAGALYSKAKGWRCYTQQGTDAGLSEAECKAWESNRPFDPYTRPVEVATAVSPATVRTGPVPVDASGVTVMDVPPVPKPQGITQADIVAALQGS